VEGEQAAQRQPSERGPVRARLVDVAAAAATSKPIASRILNGDPTLTVGDDLRNRVLQAARELGYRPHAAARGLRRAQTGALGMLVPSLENAVYTQLMRGAFRRAAERGYTVLLAEDFEEQEAGEIFARLVLEGRIDGLVVASTRPGHSLLELLDERPLPHVFVNRGVPGSRRNVLMDDALAVRLALEHLAELGHRAVGHVAGPLGLEPVARRVAAFHEEARRLGLETRVVEAELDEAGGARGCRELLEARPRPSALYVSTVSQGVGALNAAWELGVQVPGSLSVVAHADVRLADYLVPPLTAVRMPLAELGGTAVDALVEQIETGVTRDVVLAVEPRLVVRASTVRPIESPGATC
jgi:LacI family transcriptional regulator